MAEHKEITLAVCNVAAAIRQIKEKPGDKHRLELASNLMSLGNIAAGALLFGQAFSGFPFDYQIAVVGLLALTVLYATALYLMKGGERV